MPKLNKQAPDSQSALMNNAAKDDCLGQPASASAGSEVYKIGSLLANDPGSAVFYGVKGDGVSYDANNNSITVQAGVDEFQYAVRMANGTYSWATAHIGLGSTELVTNGSFEQTNPALITNSAYSEWTGYSALPGWANMNGTQLEVVNSGYSGINSVAGTHWLDTQDSPAPIDIAQVLKLAQGQTAQMKFVVAAEHVVLPGVDLVPVPTNSLISNSVAQQSRR